MRFLVHYGKTFTVLLLLFPFLGISATYLYMQYAETKKEIVEIVQESMLDKKYELLEIYTEYLSAEFGSHYVEVLKSSDFSRKQAETALRLMKDSQVQYLYLLYIDEKNRLRYLVDTTKDIDERGEFKQRFFPQKDIWRTAQKSQKTEVTAQKEIDKLWISMAYPIISNGKTVALLGIDFSHAEYIEVNKTLIPLEHIYLYSAVFIIVMLMSAFIQLVMYYNHRKKSFIDPLTGMYNRQYLHELLQKYPVGAFQVLIMDLDHFKQVNDIYGHDAGDEVLRTVSARIQSVIRKKDILIRYGGEEFILLVAQEDKEIVLDLADRVRRKIKADPIALEECQLNVTISMGLNPVPGESKSFEHAVKIADQGLYKAKQMGRDRIEIYDDNAQVEVDAQQKMCAVKEALDLNKIFCVYQPIFCTKTMQIDKYELLIRMYNMNNEVIEPDNFLPSIRYTQVYIHLTKRVLELAFEALREHDVKLSINLDVQDLFNDEILEHITAIFKANNSLAKRLTIEILENDEILEFEMISERLAKIQALGIAIAIDDFGSGYANYRYILNMDIDVVKIDGSLIRGLDKRDDARKIVDSIHMLAQSLGIKTVAEHVETEAEFEVIKALNVDYIQGFYLAKPDINFKSVNFLNDNQKI